MDDRAELRAVLLRLHQSLDAPSPLASLTTTLAALWPGSVVVLWSSRLSLCWGVERLPASHRRAVSALPLMEVGWLGGASACESGLVRWAALPLEASSPTVVLWGGPARSQGVERISLFAELWGPQLSRIVEGIAARQRGAEALSCLSALNAPLFRVGAEGMRPINPAAEGLVEREDGVWGRGAGVQVIDVEASQALRRRVAEVLSGDAPHGAAVEVPRGQDRRSLWAVLMRDERASACWVLMHDPARLAWGELPPGLYGLSAAERAVVRWTVRGYSTPEVAEELKISPWTVRSHLKRVFVKTGTHRQSELVALLAPVMMLLRPDGAD